MTKFLEFLNGKKTYLAATGLVLSAVISFATGEMTLGQSATNVLEGLGLAGLRAGVSKS